MLFLLLAIVVLAAGLLRCSWGPGTHLEYAERVFRRRRELLPSQVAGLLKAEQNAYFYGNLAADIVNFKGYGGHYNHCHRWTIIDDMRSHASSANQEAFILGYLSHLAADTIAHNHFVPYHLLRYARTGLGHLYWEMYADRFVPESRWGWVTSLKANRDLDQLDELINATVPKTILPKLANKLIFNHVLLVSERERWRRGVDKVQSRGSATLTRGFLDRFRSAAVGRVRLALHPKGRAQLAHIDTNGKLAQSEARRIRRAVLARVSDPQQRFTALEREAGAFLQGMQSPPEEQGEAHWD